MLHAVKHYVSERQSGLRKAAGYIGGVYLLGQYALERLDDVRSSVMQDRMAKENLRRRFEQNQQDVSFTIMALLPTLSGHILEEMDVEAVTRELQLYSKALKAPPESQPPASAPAPSSESSLASSTEVFRPSLQDGRSDDGSASVLPSVHENGAASDMSASSASWVDQFPSLQSSQISLEHSQGSALAAEPVAPVPTTETDLSQSMSSTSSASLSIPGVNGKLSPPKSTASDTTNSITKSKAELWNEVKILTFTRTLTVMYSITLLSLFTHIQLSLLGRSKYTFSVIQTEREERMRERMERSGNINSLFWEEHPVSPEDGDESSEVVSEETERKFLTLSWWILHVGWKDIGERVRKGVEEAFEGVSLKTKFSSNDLFRLVSDVRRRVEYEVTFEGHERRINFMSALLPPTTETLQHVLVQGGLPADIVNEPDPKFDALLAESRAYILSGSFQRVLEVCLDEATDILFSGLQRHIFSSAAMQSGLDERDYEVRERLAAMLPGLARWCHLALQGLPNDLVDRLANVREMEAFSAIIYSSYEDRFW